MKQTHHTLKHKLTKTVLLSSAIFFTLISLVLMLSFHSLEGYVFKLMEDHSVDTAIFSVIAWIATLMVLLLFLILKALHISLKQQLVTPVEQLYEAVEDTDSNDTSLHQLKENLPDEAVNIFEVFERLKHTSDPTQQPFIDMMSALPSCFWWSHDGKTYSGISGKCAAILNQSGEEIKATPLWSWGGSNTPLSANLHRLEKAIQQHQKKLDFAYQIKLGDMERWLGESVTLCYDQDGNLKIAYGIINDISTRKNRQQKQAEQLELVHRMETTATLAGGIAHEFNNALAGMNGNVFLIKQSTSDAETLNRIVRIEQLIDRSATMVDSMLSFARKSFLRPVPVHLVDFLKQLQSVTLPSLPDHTQFDLIIQDELQHDPLACPIIQADKKKLQEVLLQLLDNAKRATSASQVPRISMRLERFKADEAFLRQHPKIASSHILHLQLQDNGCGIPKHLLDRIFDPFFTTREVGTGTGLGLSMTHGYIHQLGGTIDVESEVNRGTTFNIYFPCMTESHQPAHPDTLLRGNGETVLVVDDDQIFRESTCDVLTRMGYHTISAWDGKEAIKQFEQHQHEVKLIFLDILMPGLNGIQTARRIRNIAPAIPIIFLTAYDRTQPLEPEVYEDHAELINKPFRISILSQAIQKVLRK